MRLTDLPIPPRPAYFGPDGAPPGVALQLDAFGAWATGRPKIIPRVGVVHTNAASVEGNLASQIRWGNAGTNNTKPHYCVNAPQPTKVLRSDLRAIANSTGDSIEKLYGERDASFWTIAIETADSGTKADPGVSDFLYDHAEIVARIVAYESIVWNIPVVVPGVWNSTGWVTHTWPFPYPHFTTANGKTCPGAKKKVTFRDQIIPRATQIVAAWTTNTPDPEEPTVTRYFTTPASSIPVWRTDNGLDAHWVNLDEYIAAGAPTPERITATEAKKFRYFNEIDRSIVLGV